MKKEILTFLSSDSAPSSCLPVLNSKKQKQSKKGKVITLYFDGSCLPTNPGYSGGIGVHILNGKFSKKISQKVESKTLISNNVTEYGALIAGLEYLLMENLQKEKLKIFGDSNLVVKQCKKEWKIKKGIYASNALKCQELLKNFNDFEIKWIPREQNTVADELSNPLKVTLIKTPKKYANLTPCFAGFT